MTVSFLDYLGSALNRSSPWSEIKNLTTKILPSHLQPLATYLKITKVWFKFVVNTNFGIRQRGKVWSVEKLRQIVSKYSIPKYCLARQNSFIVRAPWVVEKQRESTGHCLTTFLRKNVSYAGRQLCLKTLTMGTVKNRYDISVTQTHLMDSSFCTLRLTKLSCIGYGYLRQLMFKIWL